MRNLTASALFMLILCFAIASAYDLNSGLFEFDPNYDAAQFMRSGPVKMDNNMDNQWDLLFSGEVGALVNDTQLYGVEFAGNHFYVTGGNTSAQPNYIYIVDRDATSYTQFEQWNSGGWGWRDLTYDGTYLYGSSNYTINCFDLDGNWVPEMDITSPITPNRALAYDPVTDHFWTAGSDALLYEIDRDGNVIWSGETGLTVNWGMAWDNGAPNGPWLWLFAQTEWPLTTLVQFDPVNHVQTGVTYTIPYLPGATQQLAAGLFFSEEWDPGVSVIGGLAQADPGDMVFVLEMYGGEAPNITVNITYVSGSPVPASGGNLVFDIFVENLETTAVNFDGWLETAYEGGDPVTVVLRSFTDFQPGWTVNRPATWYPIPASYAAGNYTFFGKVGIHPDEAWDQSGFLFVKEGTDYVAGFEPFAVDGAPNPFDVIQDNQVTIDQHHILTSYPNPFNPSTMLSYKLETASKVRLSVFDVSGRVVANLVDGYRNAGSYEVTFDASNLPSGVYFARLSTADFTQTQKLMLVK